MIDLEVLIVGCLVLRAFRFPGEVMGGMVLVLRCFAVALAGAVAILGQAFCVVPLEGPAGILTASLAPASAFTPASALTTDRKSVV